jgi:phosphoribosylformylglycinamidine synthase subunit PurQ / glutaminase
VTEAKPRIAVVVFPGSNDDRDAALALESLGADPLLHWHGDGDLRAGAIARFSPAMKAVADFAADGGPVLGICNGFQVLCEAGLLPGVLRPNESLSFVCEDVPLRVERADVAFLTRCEPGQRLTIPIKHGEGCYFADEKLLAELEDAGQIVLRYQDNPNGSIDSIAGVVNAEGNVMGLMPHPEHAVDPLIGSGSTDGALILEALVDRAREHLFAAA